MHTPRFFAFFLAASLLGCGSQGTASRSPNAGHPQRSMALVSSYHQQSTEAALQMLAQGGNAFDAFVAATFVDYVVSPGVTSAAGPLGAMVHVAATGQTLHLDGGFNELVSPCALENIDQKGRAFAVPGAVAALFELSRLHGRLPFRDLLVPAIRVARDGFEIDAVYAGILASRRAILEGSAYARETFFPSGELAARGERLRLPALADFFARLAEEGLDYFYRGSWTTLALATISEARGCATSQDFDRYRAEFRPSFQESYRGHIIHSPGGRVFGGLAVLLALKILEADDLRAMGHFNENPATLERLIRASRAVRGESWIYDPSILDREDSVRVRLNPSAISRLREQAFGNETRDGLVPSVHSYHLIVRDREGNIASGTNTILSAPFGDGLFVQGVPLNTAAYLTAYRTNAGERYLSPFAVHMVEDSGQITSAFGAFGSSLVETELQMLVDRLDFDRDAETIAHSLRFGSPPFDLVALRSDTSKNWVDQAFTSNFLAPLREHGLQLVQEPQGDVGFGVAITQDAPNANMWSGAALPNFHHPVWTSRAD